MAANTVLDTLRRAFVALCRLGRGLSLKYTAKEPGREMKQTTPTQDEIDAITNGLNAARMGGYGI